MTIRFDGQKRRAVHSARRDKPTGSGMHPRDADLYACRGSHAPLFGGRSPDAKNNPIFSSRYSRAVHHSILVRFFTLSLSLSLSPSSPSFSVATTNSSPLLRGLIPSSSSSVASPRKSGTQNADTSAFLSSRVPLIVHSQARLATTGCTPRLGCTQPHTHRTPFRRVERARTDRPTAGQRSLGRFGRRNQLFFFVSYSYSERKARWGKSCICRLDNAATRSAQR